MKLFTSDLQFFQRLMGETRGYASVEEHDEAIVARWNEQVNPTDEVWILGDLTLKKIHRARPLVERLAGDLRLVLGNHDTAHPMHQGWHTEYTRALELFSFVGTMASIRISGETILMSHFPYRGDHTEVERFEPYRLPESDHFLLHGHTHSTERSHGAGTLHVGWDAWGRLVTEGEVAKAVHQWKETKDL